MHLRRAGLVAFLALAVLSSVACSSSEVGGVAGDESDLTERKIVTHTAYVTGSYVNSRAEGEASLKAACESFTASQKAIAGAAHLDTLCGQPTNLASGGFAFAAVATTRFVVDVDRERGLELPEPSRTSTVIGAYAGSLSESFESWRSACAAELERAKTLFGERLLGGGCGEPKNLASGGFVQSSSFEALVRPPSGTRASLEGTVVGAYANTLADGLSAWRAACDRWSANVLQTSGAHLFRVDCGSPENVASSGYVFHSTGIVEVARGAEAPAASGGLLVRAGYASSLSEASVAWVKGCEAAHATARETFGERLLATTCAPPSNIASGGFIYASHAPMLLAPAGKTKVTVFGYVLTGYASNLSKGADAIAKAVADTLREEAVRIGASRIEGFEAAEPENLASNGYIFATETKTTLGIDIPAGGLEPMTASVPVQVSGSSLGDAAVAFAQACRTEADAAKERYGERFLAASCPKPSRTGSNLEGELVVWFVP